MSPVSPPPTPFVLCFSYNFSFWMCRAGPATLPQRSAPLTSSGRPSDTVAKSIKHWQPGPHHPLAAGLLPLLVRAPVSGRPKCKKWRE